MDVSSSFHFRGFDQGSGRGAYHVFFSFVFAFSFAGAVPSTVTLYAAPGQEATDSSAVTPYVVVHASRTPSSASIADRRCVRVR